MTYGSFFFEGWYIGSFFEQESISKIIIETFNNLKNIIKLLSEYFENNILKIKH